VVEVFALSLPKGYFLFPRKLPQRCSLNCAGKIKIKDALKGASLSERKYFLSCPSPQEPPGASFRFCRKSVPDRFVGSSASPLLPGISSKRNGVLRKFHNKKAAGSEAAHGIVTIPALRFSPCVKRSSKRSPSHPDRSAGRVRSGLRWSSKSRTYRTACDPQSRVWQAVQ
jgi:hypothetical protein